MANATNLKSLHDISNRTALHAWQYGPQCRGTSEPGYARCAHFFGRAALPEAIPVRSARGGNSPCRMVVYPEPDYPAVSLQPVGQKIRIDLDARGFAPESPYAKAGQAAGWRAGC